MKEVKLVHWKVANTMSNKDEKIVIWKNGKRVVFKIFSTIYVTSTAVEKFIAKMPEEMTKDVPQEEVSMRIRIALWKLTFKEIAQAVYTGKYWYVYTRIDGYRVKLILECRHDDSINIVVSFVNADEYKKEIASNVGPTDVDEYITPLKKIVASDNAIYDYITLVENVPHELARHELVYAVERYKNLKTDTTLKFRLSNHDNLANIPTYRGRVYNSYRQGFYVWLRNISKEGITLIISVRRLDEGMNGQNLILNVKDE